MSAIPGGVARFQQTPWYKKYAPMAIPLVVGACIGWAARGDRVVEKVVEKKAEVVADESAGIDLTKHETKVEQPKVKTRIIYRDGPVRERIVERSGGSETTKDTNVKVKDDLHVAERITEKATTVVGDGRWAFRALGSIDSRGTVAVGAGFEYRVVGPLVVGPWVTVPVAGAPGAVTVGVSAGLRLP